MEQLVVVPKEKTPEDTRLNSDEEPADLPVFADRSKRPHTFFTHVPKCPNCQICKLAKATRNRLEARGDLNLLPQKFGDALTADHKIPSAEIRISFEASLPSRRKS